MATFAQQPQDENLVSGWNVQGNNFSTSTFGQPGGGYAEAGVIGAVTTASQPNAGFPYPPGAANVGAENSGSYTTSVLENESYSVSQVAAATGTNPTAVGAAITVPTGGYTAKVLSGLSLVVTNLDSGTVSYTVNGSATVDVAAAGDIIPAGAAVTSTAGVVFNTVGA